MAIKGRGATHNQLSARFDLPGRQAEGDWRDWLAASDEDVPPLRTTVTQEAARTIIARNSSPDIGFDQSVNACRGCDHAYSVVQWSGFNGS